MKQSTYMAIASHILHLLSGVFVKIVCTLSICTLHGIIYIVLLRPSKH